MSAGNLLNSWTSCQCRCTYLGG